MGKFCEICETSAEKCVIPGWHAMAGAKEGNAGALVVRQEILFGKWEEERRVDAEKGREVDAFKWRGEMMEAGEERDELRAHGRQMAQKCAEAREERIGRQKCEICMVGRSECAWPEVHFSRKKESVAFCNEAMYVMHQERCKADEKNGRLSFEWKIGTRMGEEDVEGRERARLHGLLYAARDAVAYEARCLLEPGEEAAGVLRAERNAAYHAKTVAKMRTEREEAVADRIYAGELVEAKFWPKEKGVWAPVDKQTKARHFWEMGIGCEEHVGKLWVERKELLASGVEALVPGRGVRGLKGGSVGAAGGGWVWRERTLADARAELEGALARCMTGGVASQTSSPPAAGRVGWGAAGAAVGRVRQEEAVQQEETARVTIVKGRIARGELMAVQHEETAEGPKVVDVKQTAKEFKKAGVWCVEHEGVLYVKTLNAHEASEGNTRVVEACEGGWAPVGVEGGVEIEMRDTGGAESAVAGSRMVE